MKLFGNDKETITNMIELFISDTTQQWKQLTNEYDNANLPAMAEFAHKLKASIDMMGIDTLKEVIRDIEKCGKGTNSGQDLPNLISSCNDTLDKVIGELKKEIIS